MDVDKSLLLQKQIRHNTEDLQKEFLDLKAWEEEMKRKDAELCNVEQEQNLPPVRSKKVKCDLRSVEDKNKSYLPRIKSCDYASWERFDAEKACLEVDDSNEKEEVKVMQERITNYDRALQYKEAGNNFVKEKNWLEAIKSYNQAIKIYPHDPIFYANRALCHLKLDNLYSADSDCTTAIKLDDSYVKAYHRRALARMDLKRYKEAKQDIEKMLKLVPFNKEATKMLEKINKIISTFNPIILTNYDDEEEECVIPVKPNVDNKLIDKLTITKDKKTENKMSSNTDKSVKKDTYSKSNQISKTWLPDFSNNFEIVKPVHKLPHHRSQKPLKRIVVKKENFSDIIIPKSMSVLKYEKEEQQKSENDKLISNINENFEVVESLQKSCFKSQESLKRITVKEAKFDTQILPKSVSELKSCEEEHFVSKLKEKNKTVDRNVSYKNENVKLIQEIDEDVVVPPPPKTSVQFIFNWMKIKSPIFRYKYLKQLSPTQFPELFQESLESNILSEILIILSTEFVKRQESVFMYLESLSNVKRFRTLTLFLSKSDKQALDSLFLYCCKEEKKSIEEITNLKKKYELSN